MSFNFTAAGHRITWPVGSDFENATKMTLNFQLKPDATWPSNADCMSHFQGVSGYFLQQSGVTDNLDMVFFAGTVGLTNALADRGVWRNIHIVYDGDLLDANKIAWWRDGVPGAVVPSTPPANLGNLTTTSLTQGSTTEAAVFLMSRLAAWSGATIRKPKPIRTIMNGCANLIAPGFRSVDTLLAADPPIDLANQYIPTVAGPALSTDEPTVLSARPACRSMRYRGRPPLRRTSFGVGVGVFKQ